MSVLILLNILTLVGAVYLKLHSHSFERLYQTTQSKEYESLKTVQLKMSQIQKRYYSYTYLDDFITPKTFEKLIWIWFFVSATIALITFGTSLRALLLFVFLVSVPFAYLEMRIHHIVSQIDKDLLDFFTTINANLIQSQDLIKALVYAQAQVDNPYILKGIVRFNVTIKAGLSPDIAFSMLHESTIHPYLKYVYLNIEQAHLKRGDVIKLMGALEEEYSLIQVERNKRQIELSQYRKFTWISLGIVLLTALKVIRSQDYILNYYRQNDVGGIVALLLFCLTVLGFIALIHTTAKKVD